MNISVYYYKVKLHSSTVFRLRVGVWCSSCPVHAAVSLPSHSAGAGVPRRGSVSPHSQDSSCSAPPRSLPRPSPRLARTVSSHHRQLELPLLYLRLYVSIHSAATLLNWTKKSRCFNWQLLSTSEMTTSCFIVGGSVRWLCMNVSCYYLRQGIP